MLHKLPGLIVLAALFVCASRADAQRLSVNLIASQVSVQNGIADSTFRIEVRNDDDTPLENVCVVFADDIQLPVGNVPGEGSATSEEMSRSFDISESPSENTPIPITLKFSIDGEQVEQAATVILKARQ